MLTEKNTKKTPVPVTITLQGTRVVPVVPPLLKQARAHASAQKQLTPVYVHLLLKGCLFQSEAYGVFFP